MISLQFNNTITERDMDLLFAESVMTDPGVCSLLINKTDLEGKPFEVSGVELSKTDGDLGESDITVVIDVEGDKHGLLSPYKSSGLLLSGALPALTQIVFIQSAIRNEFTVKIYFAANLAFHPSSAKAVASNNILAFYYSLYLLKTVFLYFRRLHFF